MGKVQIILVELIMGVYIWVKQDHLHKIQMNEEMKDVEFVCPRFAADIQECEQIRLCS